VRVIHLNTERTWRGGEQQMCYLALGMRARGHEPHVICRPGSVCSERVREMGLPVREIPIRGDLDFFAARRVAGMADELGADILHAHTSRAHLAAAWGSRMARVRPACVVHRRVDFSIHKLPFRLSGLKYRRGVDRYIAVTAAVKRMLVQDGIASERIEVIHSGTDLSRFENTARKEGLRAELGIPEGARVIGNVGFLVGHKAHEYLLEAAATVLKEMPETFVVIVGEGERREFLEAKAAELGIASRVSMPGFRSDIPECLREFDIFCLSSWGEGIGGVVLEAMAAGVPVVTAAAGGLDEVVQDGVNGILTPVRRSDALAEGILSILRDEDLARRLTEAGRRTVADSFSVDRMVEETLALYEDILSRRA